MNFLLHQQFEAFCGSRINSGFVRISVYFTDVKCVRGSARFSKQASSQFPTERVSKHCFHENNFSYRISKTKSSQRDAFVDSPTDRFHPSQVMVYRQACFSQVSRRLPLSKHFSFNLRSRRMNIEQPFEEERLPWYKPEQFYPVQIGQIFHSKYKVIGKLGYGAHSTTWLCRDIEYACR